MFGGDLEPPKYVKRTRPHPMKYDIQFPSVHPGYYQHVAREPNTDYHIRNLHFKQRRNANDVLIEKSTKELASKDTVSIKYDIHAEKSQIKHKIQEKVQKKMEEYEATIEKKTR
ncbi:hypothetical protein NQ317_010837 [Molorchus minor]|uniref:Uncharacterized protein n=1 Tax=Molorchus minor TaxID=1323400 RepID=A0ABQ9JLS9_9CUCU|nr:hypothetical protein NQ317_010837 [Molorchus minor]